MESRHVSPSKARLDRLADDLIEDGVGFLLDRGADAILLEEIDYALRPPVHERRVPSYGSIVGPDSDPDVWSEFTNLNAQRRPNWDFGDADLRRFADGIASWAIRTTRGVEELVVFDRSAGSERDLVILAEASGGILVQRHPSGVIRVVGIEGVARHDVSGWRHEPLGHNWLSRVFERKGKTEVGAFSQLLDFAVHDLGARGIGSLLIFHPDGELSSGHERRLPVPPALQITNPIDLAPLSHALAQTDGATVFDQSGTLRQMGVQLVPSRESEALVPPIGGTRHTSARRFSHDEPSAVVVVVSDDGPVTVLRAGVVLAGSGAQVPTDVWSVPEG